MMTKPVENNWKINNKAIYLFIISLLFLALYKPFPFEAFSWKSTVIGPFMSKGTVSLIVFTDNCNRNFLFTGESESWFYSFPSDTWCDVPVL